MRSDPSVSLVRVEKPLRNLVAEEGKEKKKHRQRLQTQIYLEHLFILLSQHGSTFN
jgi:hypothetical protein